jgi:hypothetical protein
MPDWHSEQFSLQGKALRQKRSVVRNHLVLIVGVDLVLLGGMVFLFDDLLLAIAFAVLFTVSDLAVLAFTARR